MTVIHDIFIHYALLLYYTVFLCAFVFTVLQCFDAVARWLGWEAVCRAPSVERRVGTAPVSRAPQLIITNYLS